MEDVNFNGQRLKCKKEKHIGKLMEYLLTRRKEELGGKQMEEVVREETDQHNQPILSSM